MLLTISSGRRNPFGKTAECEPTGLAFAEFLRRLPSGVNEQWLAATRWNGNHRKTENWLNSSSIPIDIDYYDAAGDHAAPPEEHRAAFTAASPTLPGSVWHHTPRGARLFFVLSAPCDDSAAWIAAARLAGAQVTEALQAARLPGYCVDEAVLLDLARFLYTPRAVVDSIQRDGVPVVLRDKPYTLGEFAPAKPKVKMAPAPTIEEATERYNREHAREFPRNSGDCPVCGHKECFGALKGDSSRWSCFSANHNSDIGLRGANCYHGDVLDLDAHAEGLKPVELLRLRGYLSPPRARATPPPGATPGAPPAPNASGIDLTQSYATLCAILRGNQVIVPEPLEYDEMRMAPTIGGVPVDDVEIGRLRERIELNCATKRGAPLRFSASDMESALLQIAKERSYNPVRSYLEALAWDGVQRLTSVAEDILGAKRTTLHMEMVRRWFISAAARVLRPGCKVDTVLILQGPQGWMKSSFFKVLAGAAFFSDSHIDISNKDAALQLRRFWIQEWPELEAMQRARSANAVKAFLSSSVDSFRPPYSRSVVSAPRHCVIVGTTNDNELLTDATGNRRYWIVPVGQRANLDLLEQQRDQLWAEAVASFRAGAQWWLDEEQDTDLGVEHEAFRQSHPWEPLIRQYLVGRSEVTTAEMLDGAVKKAAGQWTRGDEMAVASVMGALGWTHGRRMRDGLRARVWSEPARPEKGSGNA
jgi:hypothetical protein